MDAIIANLADVKENVLVRISFTILGDQIDFFIN